MNLKMMTGMMMNKNFNHLMMMYDRAYKMCAQVKKNIEEGKIEELDDILRNKSELFSSILRFEKTFKGNLEEELQRLELRKRIEEFEKSNIELLQKKQQILKKELQKVAQGKRVAGAYLSKMPEAGSSIDISE